MYRLYLHFVVERENDAEFNELNFFHIRAINIFSSRFVDHPLFAFTFLKKILD